MSSIAQATQTSRASQPRGKSDDMTGAVPYPSTDFYLEGKSQSQSRGERKENGMVQWVPSLKTKRSALKSTRPADIPGFIHRERSRNGSCTMYELIDSKCKAFIDFDYTDQTWDEAACFAARDNCLIKLCDNLFNVRKNCFDSSGRKANGSWIVSLRFIFNEYYFESGAEAGQWVNELNIDQDLRMHIDKSVYKAAGKQQLMRLPYCNKEGDSRVLKKVTCDLYGNIVYTHCVSWMPKQYPDWVISDITGCKRGRVVRKEVSIPKIVSPTLDAANEVGVGTCSANGASDIPLGKLEGLLDIIGSVSTWYDHYPEWFRIGCCLGSIGTRDALRLWLKFSRRSSKYNEEMARRIFTQANGSLSVGSLHHIAKVIDGNAYKRLIAEHPDAESLVEESLVEEGWTIPVEECHEQYVRPWDSNTKTVYIKSPCGTGKTVALSNMIKNTQNYKRCVIVVFRVSLSKQINKYMAELGFAVYSDIKERYIKPEQYPRVIIQAESLWRLDFESGIDLLCLDEVVSLSGQMLSSTQGKNLLVNFKMYERCLINSRRVVAMDASLDSDIVKFIESIRNPRGIHSTVLINNTFVRRGDDKLNMLSSYDDLIIRAKRDINNGLRIALASTFSIDKLQSAYDKLVAILPEGKKAILITSRTRELAEVRNCLNNVESRTHGFLAYDLVVYSPTIQAGVSFNLPHFDKFYGLFSNHTSVNTAHQMIERIRQFRYKTYNVFLNTPFKSTSPDTEEGHDAWVEKWTNFQTTDGRHILDFDLEAGARVTIRKTSLYLMWRLIRINLARDQNDFAARFIRSQRAAGVANINELPELNADEGKVVKTQLKTAEGVIKQAEVDRIVNAELINFDRFETLDRKRLASETLTREERAELTKYELVKSFKIPEGVEVPRWLVEKWPTWARRRSKLNAVITHNDIADKDAVLQRVYDAEYERFRNNHSRNAVSPRDDDLLRKYDCFAHKLIHEFVKICGFSHIYDREQVLQSAVKANIANNIAEVERIVRELDAHFPRGSGRTGALDVGGWSYKKLMEWVNGKMSSFYGMTVVKLDNHSKFVQIAIEKFNHNRAPNDSIYLFN